MVRWSIVSPSMDHCFPPRRSVVSPVPPFKLYGGLAVAVLLAVIVAKDEIGLHSSTYLASPVLSYSGTVPPASVSLRDAPYLLHLIVGSRTSLVGVDFWEKSVLVFVCFVLSAWTSKQKVRSAWVKSICTTSLRQCPVPPCFPLSVPGVAKCQAR